MYTISLPLAHSLKLSLLNRSASSEATHIVGDLIVEPDATQGGGALYVQGET